MALYLVSQAVGQRPAHATPWLPNLPRRAAATQTVPVLGDAVDALSGRRVNVYCWSSADWEHESRSWDSSKLGPLGPWRSYTDPTTRNVMLGPNVCTELERLRGRNRPISSYDDRRAAAWSVETVSHESVHVAGIANEARAECYGVQRAARAAIWLGLTAEEGRFLARLYWREWYPRDAASYRSTDCRDGGALDLHAGTHRWP